MPRWAGSCGMPRQQHRNCGNEAFCRKTCGLDWRVPVSPKKPPRPLDATDRRLLQALSLDARLPGRELAALAGVAESTVSQRLRSLRDSGVVRGYRTELDLTAVGLPLQAVIAVRLGAHSRKHVDSFRDVAPRLPGVLSMFHVAGGNDYLLHVAVADATALRDFVLERLTTHPAVAHTETSIVFEHTLGQSPLELEAPS